MKHTFVEASMQVVLLPQLKHSLSFMLTNLSIKCCCSLYSRGVEGQVQDPLLGREVLRRVVLSLRRLPESYLVTLRKQTCVNFCGCAREVGSPISKLEGKR